MPAATVYRAILEDPGNETHRLVTRGRSLAGLPPPE